MITHVFNSTGTIEKQYVSIIDDCFDKEQHLYFARMSQSVKGDDSSRIHCMEDYWSDREFALAIERSSKVVVHGFFDNRLCAFLALQKNILRKTYIIFWGGDLYPFRDGQTGAKNTLISPVKKWVIRSAAGVGCLLEGDYDLLQEVTGFEGSHYLVSYGFETLPNASKNYSKQLNPPLFQLGNSATKTNCHMEAIDQLAAYAAADFELICPLSYGDSDYRDQVIAYGRNKLGSKLIPLVDLFETEDYQDLLSRVAVGFFNNNRQQGLGNIGLLLSMGSKVYIRKNTSMWSHYKDELNLNVFSMEDVGSEKFEDLLRFDSHDQNSNREIMKHSLSRSEMIGKWEALFEA